MATWARRVAWTLALAAMLAGCSPKPYTGAARDLHAEMGKAGEALQAPSLEATQRALGPEAPYLPLVEPPDVKRVWITAHLNEAGDLIAGHWAYLMLRPSSWHLRYEGPREFRLRLPVAPPPKDE
ncbi:MAG: TraV family lipoprotein [Candidatus Tectomicrobia bacterium]|nr:TraV family lipoprotein [Candidatus Tectomicrobia bacterium]